MSIIVRERYNVRQSEANRIRDILLKSYTPRQIRRGDHPDPKGFKRRPTKKLRKLMRTREFRGKTLGKFVPKKGTVTSFRPPIERTRIPERVLQEFRVGLSRQEIERLQRSEADSTFKPVIRSGKLIGFRDTVTQQSVGLTLSEVRKIDSERNLAERWEEIQKAKETAKKTGLALAIERTEKGISELRGKKTQQKASIDQINREIAKIEKEIKSQADKAGSSPGERVASVSQQKINRLFALQKQRANIVGEAVTIGLVSSAFIGIVSAGLGMIRFARDPVGTAKEQWKIISTAPGRKQLVKALETQLRTDPVALLVEFWAFGKILGLAGKGLKKIPLTRYLQEEWYLLKQPANVRPFMRQIIKSSKVQEKFNPNKIGAATSADILQIEKLSAIEAQALAKAIDATGAIRVGNSFMTKLLGKQARGLTLATENITNFNRLFISNLPKSLQRQYIIRGGQLVRKASKTNLTKKIPNNVITRNLKRVKVKVSLKPKAKLKVAAAKAKISKAARKAAKPAIKTLRKVRRISRVGGEKISQLNSRVLTSIESQLGNLGIKVKFTKFKASKRVGEITGPAIKSVNSKIRLLRRNLQATKGIITKETSRIIRGIQAPLKKFNIRVKFAKFKIGEQVGAAVKKVSKPVSKVTRRAKRVVRVSGEALNKANQRVLNKVTTTFRNLGIGVRFSKFRTTQRIRTITGAAERILDRRIRLVRRGLRRTKGVITRPIQKQLNNLKVSLKSFNIRVSFAKARITARAKRIGVAAKRRIRRVTRPTRRIIRVSGEALNKANQRVTNQIKTGLGSLGIRVRFTKFKTRKGIRTITSPVSRLVDRRIRLLRRSLKASKNKITRPIQKQLNTLSNSLKSFNIRIKFIKYRVGQTISRGVRPVRRRAALAARKLSKGKKKIVTGINNKIKTINTKFRNIGLKARFKKETFRTKVRELSEPTLTSISKNLSRLTRRLKRSKGRIDQGAKRIINDINRKIPFEVKVGIRKPFPKRPGPTPRITRITKSKILADKINTERLVRALKEVQTLKGLSRGELLAIAKTFQEQRVVLFGSFAARLVGGKKLPIPHDIDFGVLSTEAFFKTLQRNLPKNTRRLYKMDGAKMTRQGSNIFDVKSVRLIRPGTGRIPAAGFTLPKLRTTTIRITSKNQARLLADVLKRTKPEIAALEKIFEAAKRGRKFRFKRQAYNKKFVKDTINKAEVGKTGDFHHIDRTRNLGVYLPVKQHMILHAIQNGFIPGKNTLFYKLLRPRKLGSQFKIPTIARGVKEAALEIPIQKLQRFGKVRVTGFGEQTTRKGLGTIEVLVKENVRRAKDPSSFIVGLRVQAAALRRKPTPLNLARARRLEVAADILSSKEFIKLLESKVPAQVARIRETFKNIDVGKLKTMNKAKIGRRVRETSSRLSKLEEEITRIRRTKPKNKAEAQKFKKRSKQIETEIKRFTTPSKLIPSRLPQSFKSILPSVIKPSRIPSRIPSSVLSRIPSRTIFSGPSSILIGSSLIPISKISGVPSRVSRVPSSIPPSKISRVPSSVLSRLSKSPISKLRRTELPPPTILKIERLKEKDLSKLATKTIQKRDFIYIPDLYSVIYGIKSKPLEKRAFLRAGRVFTGVERRKLI